VLGEGGLWDVVKCQECLTSVSRERAPRLGSLTPLGLTIG
jgi:vanillate/4-hydroxybenzoate decarboxylase subunit D